MAHPHYTTKDPNLGETPAFDRELSLKIDWATVAVESDRAAEDPEYRSVYAAWLASLTLLIPWGGM